MKKLSLGVAKLFIDTQSNSPYSIYVIKFVSKIIVSAFKFNVASALPSVDVKYFFKFVIKEQQ